MWKLIKWVTGLSFFGIIAIATVIVGAYFYFIHDLPKLESLKDYHPLTITEVYDRSGQKIGEFWKERRIILPYKEIPRKMIEAMISSEDDRFFRHSGIDYFGILRAMMENFRAGHVVQGASTITQQITKALLLTSERSYTRKIKEAFLAKQIEENFSKEEILYLYFTQTYFGNRAYGIEAAAENYFHKPLKLLTVAEMAMIAGLPKAPSSCSPLVNSRCALDRQHYVLDRMAIEGYITAEEAEAAKRQVLTIYIAGVDKDYNMQYAPWFTEYIRRMITTKYGMDRVYQGGLKVYTTLDLSKYQIADRAVTDGLRALDKRQGYKGPQRHAAEADIDITCQTLAQESLKDAPPPLILNGPEETRPAIVTFKESKLYRAVITKIDAKTKELEVCHGGKRGMIRHDDYKWAKIRNLDSAGWEGVDYVPDPAARFKVGDVVEVAVKTASAGPDDTKKPTLDPSRLYFTLEQTPEVEGALFSYDPPTGDVLAMIGGYDFKKSEFNRAMQALRQPGSSFKPFIYTSALIKGYKPDTIVNDAPISFAWGAGKIWSPKNYGNKYFGALSLASALAHSLNTVAVRLIVDVGTDFTTAACRLMGLTTPIDRYYPMALGAADVHLFETTRAYGAILSGGILPTLRYIVRIEDEKGKLLEDNKVKDVKPFTDYFANTETLSSVKMPVNSVPTDTTQPADPDRTSQPTGEIPEYAQGLNTATAEDALYNPDLYKTGQEVIAKEGLDLRPIEKAMLYGRHIPPGYVLNPYVAYTMREMMQGVVERGTAVRAKELKRPAAGKTGTTNSQSDAWFIGFVPQMIAGVWVGFDSRQSIGARETGGKVSLPIWMNYMTHSLEGQETQEFKAPEQANYAFYNPSHIKDVFTALLRHETPPDPGSVFSQTDDGESPFIGDVKPKTRTPVPSGPSRDDNYFSSDF